MTLPADELWPRVLEILKASMTRATFETWLQKTTAQEVDGRLIVLTPSSFGQDWLENRLRETIERAIIQVAGKPVPVEFRVAENGSYQPDLFFSGTYRDAYNAIVQPDKQHYCSRYFHQKWLPLLGADRWILIWEMRTRCYWNKTTGDIRDTFEATYEELAAAVGMSINKVWRLLNPEDADMAALVDKFIIRHETKRRYSRGRGGMVNDKTIWRIRLDDPLTPDDEDRLSKL